MRASNFVSRGAPGRGRFAGEYTCQAAHWQAAREEDLSGTIEIVADDTRAKIALRGAELRAWQVGNRSLLWPGDEGSWPATSPVLFPVCGWTRNGQVRIAGRRFPLGLHGFVATAMFEIAAIESDRVCFVLSDDLSTRAQYPFGFTLSVEYHVRQGGLGARLTVHNAGRIPMPYACGLHPGFRWPFGAGRAQDYCILFDAPEWPEVPVIAAGGLFSPRLREVPVKGRVLDLSPELFSAEALCFLGAASHGLRFEGPGGAIEIATRNFPHLVLWAKPPAEFLCIEAWTGYGDPEDFAGDLFDKPSMRILLPGERGEHEMSFAFSD